MTPDPSLRATFARIARAAIERSVPEARTPVAEWTFKPNVAWVRWALAEGGYAAIGLRRHLDWVTGEIALTRDDVAPDALPLLPEVWLDPGQAQGRIRLGVLLHEEDRWWPAGEGEQALGETLASIALQLRVKSERLLHPQGTAPRG